MKTLFAQQCSGEQSSGENVRTLLKSEKKQVQRLCIIKAFLV